jgi:putrescine transport system ATP-binding protein
VLLLDEPLGALDKKLREETQFELMDLQQQLGLTFIVVTHDQEEAMTMADRIAVMSHGLISQVATPAEIYEAPNSRFVAEFIGEVNIFPGKVTSAANGLVDLVCTDGMIARSATMNYYDPGTELALAVRPEKVKISRFAPQDVPVNAAKGEIWDIGYLGDMTAFHVKLDSGQVVHASFMNAKREVDDPLSYGDEVWVSFDPSAGVLLKG